MSDALDDIASRVESLSGKTIFFVYGSMKSGTTWLQLLLDAHPAVRCSGEGHFTDKLTPILQTALAAYDHYISEKNAQQKSGGVASGGFPALGLEGCAYLARMAILLLLATEADGKPVAAVGEKTPDSINNLPLLNLMFPRAKFLHIVRDPRDCAVSGWFHNQRLSPEWLEKAFPTLEDYAAVTAAGWAKEQAAAVDLAKRCPQRCLSLRYEDMLDHPAATLRAALTFLGVADDDATVAECCGKADFATLSGGRTAGQEDRASFFRKGVAGDWRNHLSDDSRALFSRKAGQWLEWFGYPV
jgi:hypothetical protein